MSYDPDEPGQLAAVLRASLEEYRRQYRRYWDIDSAQPTADRNVGKLLMNKQLESVGAAMRECVHSLRPSPATEAVRHFFREHFGLASEPTEADYALLVRALHRAVIVQDNMRIHVAAEAVDELLPRAEQRLVQLVALIASRPLSQRAASYLDRATRLYLWGFDPECLIMCRSALEAAVASRLYDEVELDKPPPPLEQLLEIAGSAGILPGYRRASNRRGWSAEKHSYLWRADRIRWSANNVVHDVPVLDSSYRDGIENGHTAILELSEVLGHLFD